MDIIETFEIGNCIADIVIDQDHGSPWDEEDGHGPVSDWTTRNKRPGELVLCEDGSSRRYYDLAAAMKLARRDGWGCVSASVDTTGMTPKQLASIAAREDYEHLRAWCNGDWHYVGVVVRPKGTCKLCGPSESLWGIESGDSEYIKQVAKDLCEVLTTAA